MFAGSPPADWLLRSPDHVALRHWEDGTVVFDGANGQLQLLNPVAGELMQLLSDTSPATAYQLAEHLLGEVPTIDDVAMVENVLEEFHSLKLIHRLAS